MREYFSWFAKAFIFTFHTTGFYRHQALQIFDCMQRHKNRYTHVMHTDLDEFILPLTNTTLHALVKLYTENSRLPFPCLSLSFRAAWMRMQCDDTDSCGEYLRSARYTQVSKVSKAQRTKTITSTLLSQVHVHSATTTHRCDIALEEAILLHWRPNPPHGDDVTQWHNNTDTQRSLYSLKIELERRVRLVWSNAFVVK